MERSLESYLAKSNLADGAKPATDALKAGAKVGFSEITLKRAKKDLSIKSSKSEFGGSWVWTLSEGDQVLPEEYHTQGDDPLRATHCKKSNNSNGFNEGDQCSTDDPLRGKDDPLRPGLGGTLEEVFSDAN